MGVAGLERAGDGLNKYSSEMRALRNKFAKDTTYDKKASYLFVVDAFEPDPTGSNIEGFMPRGRSMGFVVSGANMRTYAHELGHGAFGLEHTFPEIEEGKSNNLMDYGSGTHLTQKQWDKIEKNKFVWNWLDDEEDGAFMSGNGCELGLSQFITAHLIVDGIFDYVNNNTPNNQNLVIPIQNAIYAHFNNQYDSNNTEHTCFYDLVMYIYNDIDYCRFMMPKYSAIYRKEIANAISMGEKVDLILARSLAVKKNRDGWANFMLLINVFSELTPVKSLNKSKKIPALFKNIVKLVEKIEQGDNSKTIYGQKFEDLGEVLPNGLVKGKYSKRTFDPNKAGGAIKNLSWQNATITSQGIADIKKHLNRLEPYEWNVEMIKRLEDIQSSIIMITDFDKRFYTHELDEFERYKALGYENTSYLQIPDEVWENTHTAALEGYQIYEKADYQNRRIYVLYHPDVQR